MKWDVTTRIGFFIERVLLKDRCCPQALQLTLYCGRPLVGFRLNIGDEHELLVHKLLKSQVRKLLAVSRPLNSAEGEIRPAHIRIVDEDHPCLDAAGDAFGPLYIRGID